MTALKENLTRVTKAQMDFFHLNGYLVVEDVLDPTKDIAPIIRDYELYLDQLASEWLRSGTIESDRAGLTFEKRIARHIVEDGINVARYFDISLPDAVIREDEPMHLSQPVFELLTHPRLLDVVEAFVGPEILSNPIQHVRIKPPEAEIKAGFDQPFLFGQTGWHQDQGVARPEADDTDMLTVWIPIKDATTANGCLQVVPGSHQGGLNVHCPTKKGLTIPGKLLHSRPLPVPMKVGSVLLLHKLTQHASLKNKSDEVRWSFDLRYQPVGQPTGRDEFPAFVARSRKDPSAELNDHRQWVDLWEGARRSLAREQKRKLKHRWSTDSPVCA